MTTDLLVVVDQNNADKNKMEEIADAIRWAGGHIEVLDTEHGVIETTVDPREIPIIERMEGVSYVRPIFTYHSGAPAESVEY